MGRYLSDENTILTPQFINLPAGVAVSAGNLLTIRSDGRVYPAPQASIPATWFNNTSQKTISALTQTSYFDSSFNSTGFRWPNPINTVNSTGISGTEYTAFLVTGDGTSSFTGIRVRTMLRSNIVATTILNNTSSAQDYPQILDLGNGTFLVLYWNSATSRWVFQILNAATHAVIVAQTDVSATNAVANAQGAIAVALLSNGNVVFTYRNGTTNVFFRIISNTGASIVAETSVPVTATTLGIAANGGFFVLSYNVSSSLRFRRFTDAGVLVGSEISTGVNLTGTYAPNWRYAIHWVRSDGSLLFLNTSVTPCNMLVYNTTNTLVATVNTGINSSQVSNALVSDTLCIVYQDTNPVIRNVFKFGPDNQVKLNTPLYTIGTTWTAFAGADQISQEIHTFGPDTSVYALLAVLNGSTGAFLNYYVVSDQNATFVSSTQVVTGTAVVALYNPAFVVFQQDTVTLGQAGTNSAMTRPCAGYYFPVLQSIYGVAASNASAGQSVKVQVVGTATVTPSIAGGGSFNTLSATIPGNRGIFGGTGAVLYGV